MKQCEECKGSGITTKGFYQIKCGNCRGTGEVDIINFLDGELKPNGEVSTSMGVNTKPAHRLQYEKYWILVDPDMPEHTLNELFPNMLIHKSKPKANG